MYYFYLKLYFTEGGNGQFKSNTFIFKSTQSDIQVNIIPLSQRFQNLISCGSICHAIRVYS